VEWLGPALVFYVAVSATLVARRRLTQIARLRVMNVDALVRAIRLASDEELATAGSRASTESFESLVVSAVLDDASPAARIAAVNEHLGDLDREIQSRRDVPRVVGRASLLCGTLGSVVELTLTVAGPTGPAWAPSATSFFVGLSGFLASLEIDRRARGSEALARAEWDRVATALNDRVFREGPRPSQGAGSDVG
jgi:hypothetical protein